MTNGTCTTQDCDEDASARSMCKRHYQRWYGLKTGRISSAPHEQNCTRCNAPIVSASTRKDRRKYCSIECKSATLAEVYSERTKATNRARREAGAYVCKWDGCGKILVSGGTKWCDAHRASVKALESPDSRSSVCGEFNCSRPLRAKGMCNMHYKRVLRSQGRLPSPVWDERRRSNHHARRAIVRGATNTGQVSIAALLERDGNDCPRCHEPINMNLAYPNRMSRSIDHTRPISKGGAHSMENCTLMHLGCNLSKGNRE